MNMATSVALIQTRNRLKKRSNRFCSFSLRVLKLYWLMVSSGKASHRINLAFRGQLTDPTETLVSKRKYWNYLGCMIYHN